MVSKRLSPLILFFFALLLPGPLAAQAGGKKPLDHDAYDIWKSIRSQTLSADGEWLVYTLVPGDGDATLMARNLRTGAELTIPRGTGPRITPDSRFLVFTIEPVQAVVDSLRALGKRGDDLPKNAVGVVDLDGVRGSGPVEDPDVFTAEGVKSWQIPEEEGAMVAFLLEKPVEESDSAAQGEEEAAPGPGSPAGARPAGRGPGGGHAGSKEKADGTELVLRDLLSGRESRFQNVMTFAFDESGQWLAYTAESKDGEADGVFGVAATTGEVAPVLTGEGKYTQLSISKEGGQVAFLTNRDDWKADDPAYALYHGILGRGEARLVANAETAGIPQGWEVSEHGDVSFSEMGSRILFGTAPIPPPPPSDTLPEDKQVHVDIWNWKDPLIQPMQLVQADDERNRTYQAYASTEDLHVVQLATLEIPEVTVSQDGDGDLALATTNPMVKYGWYVSHDKTYQDVYLMDVATGEAEMILEKTSARVSFSPDARYLTWWDGKEADWFAMDVATRNIRNLTETIPVPVYDELDDHPDDLPSHGSAGWLDGDQAFLVYDAYDIWALDPTGGAAPRNLTEGVGRTNHIRFRYEDPSREGGRFRGFGFGRGGGEEAIDPGEDAYLSAFNVQTKASGYYQDRFDGNREPRRLIMGDYAYDGLRKAEDADVFMLTRSTFREFPDIWITDGDLREMQKVTDANPQQADYLWGDEELVEWISNDGIPLQGILVKPEGFDPSKKYPMMVYFYERNSDNLHRYQNPSPGTSVNQSFYVSRGYVYFVPDIPYEIGHPGESAVDAVVPGVLKIVDQGYIDKDRIGAQGHSWGGYQLAYMITRVNLFAAVEAGAPVANMTSAYGGIRWDSGMNRQFQYEHTQSRIGGSLWAETLRYINNSPLFEADKIQTPLLMIHNDRDGAVPWYQGIEMYMALRRLQKPVWMFNYNGEPHGLRKRPNQKDWTIRLQQFFDHYLMGAPEPVWMTDGVPAVMKGKTLGLEIRKD
jgi:dipeptidyl aminopeptidase/acylaminoacyl peptidase